MVDKSQYSFADEICKYCDFSKFNFWGDFKINSGRNNAGGDLKLPGVEYISSEIEFSPEWIEYQQEIFVNPGAMDIDRVLSMPILKRDLDNTEKEFNMDTYLTLDTEIKPKEIQDTLQHDSRIPPEHVELAIIPLEHIELDNPESQDEVKADLDKIFEENDSEIKKSVQLAKDDDESKIMDIKVVFTKEKQENERILDPSITEFQGVTLQDLSTSCQDLGLVLGQVMADIPEVV